MQPSISPLIHIFILQLFSGCVWGLAATIKKKKNNYVAAQLKYAA